MAAMTHIAVLPVQTDLDVRTADRVRDEIDQLIGAGCRRIILNMANTAFIDSLGMGMLFAELRKMRALGGLISLTGVSPDLLVHTGPDLVGIGVTPEWR